MEIKLNRITILNIVVSLVLIYIAYRFQQNFCLARHDYALPYLQIYDLIDYGRIPAAVLTYIINNFLPQFLNIHTQEFISGIGALIKSFLFFMVCYAAATGFYLYNKKSFCILKNKLTLIILPVCFFLLAIPWFFQFCPYDPFQFLYNNDLFFGNIGETIVFCEYFICLFFYFLFFGSFIYILFEKDKIKPIYKILIIINSFLLGFWNEVFNLSTLFSILLMLLILKLFYKEVFDVKKLLILLIPFFAGFLCFYIFSDYLTGSSLAVDYRFDANVNIKLFIKKYVQYLLKNNVMLYFSIAGLIFLLKKKKKEPIECSKLNIIILLCCTIILGYLITNILFVFINEIYNQEASSFFLFEREFYQYQFVNILTFVILILLGAVYFEYQYSKKFIIIILIITFISLTNLFNISNKIIQENNIDEKLYIYSAERSILTFNIFGERALVFDTYNDMLNFRSYFPDFLIKKYVHDYKDKDEFYLYTNRELFPYLKNEYKENFIGIKQVKNNEYVNKEYTKRIKLLNKAGFLRTQDEKMTINKISFNSLNKFKTLKLTLKDIDKMEKITGDEVSDILLKARAYINYRDGNLTESLNLYNKYLSLYGFDHDVIIYINQINNQKQVYQNQQTE